LLRLEGLTVAGFKSFADRTDLRFPDGITCIVGPNGCGKSNVLDAVSWVLGEQSARTLRGARMEDVIFAGSRNRRPAGAAEVTLRFTPRERESAQGLPDEPDPRLLEPLAVTRRLYRNGDSEYLINGERARLKDIVNLIRGTGMGTRVYSIIEQGRVDQILNSKPTDRRALIEEAAGITGYRVKRRAAKLKLEESERNLERVTDIIAEIERQLRSLKRQASTARRYRRLAGRQRIVLRALLAVKHERLADLLAAAEEELARLESAADEAGRTLAGLEESSAGARDQVAETESRRDGIVRQAHDIQLELERSRNVLAAARQRIDENQGDVARNEQAGRAAQAGVADLEARHGEARQQLERLGTDLEAARTSLEERAAGTRAVKDRLAETHRLVADAKEGIFELMSEAAGLRNRKQEAAAALDRLRRQVERLAESLREAEAARGTLGAELAAGETRLAGSLARESDVAEQLAAVRDRLADVDESLSTARQEAGALVRRRQDAEAQLAAANEMVRTRAAFAEGVREVMADPPAGALGPVADFLRVPAGDEQAVEKALGVALQAIVFRSRDEAGAALAARAANGQSEVHAVFPTGAEASEPEGAPHVDPRVLGTVAGRVRVAEDVAWLQALLPDALVVATGDVALEVAARHLDRMVVSRDGLLCGPGGWASAGRSRGDGPGILETRARQEQLESEVATIRTAAEALSARVNGLERERGEAAAAHDRLRDELASAEKDVVSVRQGLEGVRRAAEAADARHQAVRHEHDAAAAELADGEERQSEFDRRLAENGDKRVQLERQLHEGNELATQLEADVEGADAELSRLREELAVKGERREAARQEVAAVARELEQARLRARQVAEEAGELRAREEQAQELVTRMEEALAQGTARHGALAGELALAEKAVADGRTGLVQFAERLRELRVQHDAHARKASDARVRRERLASELEHLVADCRRELGVEPAELERPVPPAEEADEPVAEELGAEAEMVVAIAAAAEPEVVAEAAAESAGATDTAGSGEEDAEDADDRLDVVVDESLPWVDGELDLAALEAEAEELRLKLSRIGPVNLVAIDDYDKLAERHSFLAGERDDLVESIKSLRKTIDEIDDLSRRLFLEAFEQIRGSCDQAFQTLFRGGRAALRLQEEEDPLECGIEIIAQPPGKRLQNMMLLSGGEKALTAIALLFALFRFKPSPFCILDEVDAPLDEANVVRFATLVEELAKETQFVVITHNRRTMERGDVLYGVTMEEPGCSKLVSVRFDGLRGESAA